MNTTELDPETIIHLLRLEPLPGEGGLFRQTYRSQEQITADCLPERYPRRAKPFATTIFYLLTSDPNSFSAFHKLPTDEVYHFYLGDPLELTLLFEDGTSQQVMMGQDLRNGQQLQYVAPGGVWQGSRVVPGGRFSLLGTTMAPGYTDDDFILGGREDLLARYPHERERIFALTRD